MRIFQFAHARAFCACFAVLLFLAAGASAANGREFAGYFDVSDVEDQGDVVQLTLHLQLYNNGQDNERSVIIALQDSGPEMTLRGSFPPVKVWKVQQPLNLSKQLTVAKRDYDSWMAGASQPNLVIFFRDPKGHSWQQGAQVRLAPLVAVSSGQ